VVLEAITELHGDERGQQDPLLAALERAAGQPPAAPGTEDDDAARPHVRVHGANLDLQPGQFQNRIAELLERAGEHVTFIGAYDHDDLHAYMAEVDWVIIPSIWWENSPLVIQEAFHFGRPV